MRTTNLQARQQLSLHTPRQGRQSLGKEQHKHPPSSNAMWNDSSSPGTLAWKGQAIRIAAVGEGGGEEIMGMAIDSRLEGRRAGTNTVGGGRVGRTSAAGDVTVVTVLTVSCARGAGGLGDSGLSGGGGGGGKAAGLGNCGLSGRGKEGREGREDG